ncbi:MAG TPA: hypothetical protein VKR29_13090 [Candidatus Binataceae bacterium]|nr:hypothetical protein [Candidatus Binataceae bacterium]
MEAATISAGIIAARLFMIFLPWERAELLRLLLILHLLDLPALLLDLLLLRIHLLLGLLIGILIVLELIAYRITGRAAQSRANQRACRRMAHRGSDQRAAHTSNTGTAQSSFFASAERLSAASYRADG